MEYVGRVEASESCGERERFDGGGGTLTSLVCHTNNRAFGGNVATVSARWTNSTKDDEFLWDPPATFLASRYFTEDSGSSGPRARSNGEEVDVSRFDSRTSRRNRMVLFRCSEMVHSFREKTRGPSFARAWSINRRAKARALQLGTWIRKLSSWFGISLKFHIRYF